MSEPLTITVTWWHLGGALLLVAGLAILKTVSHLPLRWWHVTFPLWFPLSLLLSFLLGEFLRGSSFHLTWRPHV